QKKINLGNLNPTRDFTFIKDTINGFLEIYKSDKLYGEIINIGMNEEISIGNLVKLIADQMNEKIDITIDAERVRPQNSEVERLICDNSKILSNTKWHPKYSLETGIYETIEWLRSNLKLYKSNIYNV
ncbi:GDP-mannose 4,6-dehydratase, partial [bacterium]|nr:GDP-mannose 4,6-dehydratase [bacterium]